jgi:large subunit ribosomal protein L3
MTNTYFGTKKNMSEAFLGENRVAVTKIELYPMKVAKVVDGKSTQVVFGPTKKHPTRALSGHLKGAGVTSGFVREIPFSEGDVIGMSISPSDVKPGTVVSVQGTTKGKGFAGVVKRWGFAGGPKTHGQSDRHRAPGSIGQGTTPGRVHRGKKMAGHMGTDTKMVKNMTVVAVDGNAVWVTGPVPGSKGSLIKLIVTAQNDAPALTYLKDFAKKEEMKSENSVETPIEEKTESNESTNPVEEPTK